MGPGNLAYSHETAGLYMHAAQAVERGYIKIATITNLGLRKALALADQNERRARGLGLLDAPPRRPRMGTRRRRFGSGLTRSEHQDARQLGTENALRYGDPDPNREWPRPQHDGEMLYVKWRMPGAPPRRAYVWLAADAHGIADGMFAALRYHSVMLKFGHDDLGHIVSDHVAAKPDRWKEICWQLRTWSFGAESDNGGVIWGRDPAVLQVVTDLYDTVNARPGYGYDRSARQIATSSWSWRCPCRVEPICLSRERERGLSTIPLPLRRRPAGPSFIGTGHTKNGKRAPTSQLTTTMAG